MKLYLKVREQPVVVFFHRDSYKKMKGLDLGKFDSASLQIQFKPPFSRTGFEDNCNGFILAAIEFKSTSTSEG